jgi:hypothetical protein
LGWPVSENGPLPVRQINQHGQVIDVLLSAAHGLVRRRNDP